MTKLIAYFDDSGTHAGSDVTVWGGFVGTEAQWAHVDQAWTAKLQSPLPGKPPLRKFSVRKCARADKQFRGYSVTESLQLRSDMRDIIAASGVNAVAVAVKIAAHKALVLGWNNYFYGDPETMALGGCQFYTKQVAERDHPGFEHITFRFDQGRRDKKLAEMFRRDGHYFPQKDFSRQSLSFELVETYPGLQAADTMATELYWHLSNGLKYGFEHRASDEFADLLNRVPHTLSWLDEEALGAMVTPQRAA